MAKRDYYEVLGVGRDSDPAAIKKAYRNLAMEYHPDRNQGDAESAERMKEINEAYAVLSDDQKRRLYDVYGHAGLEGFSQDDLFRGVDFSSLFREFGLGDMFGFGDGLFDGLFGRRTASRRGPRRGADLRYDLSLTLEEAAFGAEKTIDLTRAEACGTCGGSGAKPDGLDRCEACGGTGQVVREQRSGSSLFRQISFCSQCGGQGQIVKEPCEDCEGKGVIEKAQDLSFHVPAGADTGHSIRLPGEGEVGEGGPGDLYIVLRVEQHPLFERHGADLYLQKELDFTRAALGGEVAVPTMNGDVTLDIPEGTQTGAVFRVLGRGMPHLDGRGRGDEYVIASVVTPVDLTEREKGLLRQFQGMRQKPEGKRAEED
jgi:molecular chaperone DnaJ